MSRPVQAENIANSKAKSNQQQQKQQQQQIVTNNNTQNTAYVDPLLLWSDTEEHATRTAHSGREREGIAPLEPKDIDRKILSVMLVFYNNKKQDIKYKDIAKELGVSMKDTLYFERYHFLKKTKKFIALINGKGGFGLTKKGFEAAIEDNPQPIKNAKTINVCGVKDKDNSKIKFTDRDVLIGYGKMQEDNEGNAKYNEEIKDCSSMVNNKNVNILVQEIKAKFYVLRKVKGAAIVESEKVQNKRQNQGRLEVFQTLKTTTATR